jgi:hypothetical protein
MNTLVPGARCADGAPKLHDADLPTLGGTVWEIMSLLFSGWWR